MADRRRSSPQGKANAFTVLAYAFAVLMAFALCGAIGPGGLWRRSGVRKEYRSYQVLELPVSRKGIDRGPLAAEGGEVPFPHDKLMRYRRLTLPEYTEWLQKFSWEGSRLKVSQDGVRYQLYYVPAGEETTRIPIPVGYRYAISGDGWKGFIVTIWEDG